MRVFPTHEYGNIELTNAEAQLVDLVHGYQEKIAVIAALKTHCNAEKVRDTLALWDRLKKPHASYTLYPIIRNIGERTPEQYIADTDRACAELNAMWQRYFRGEISLAEWKAYLFRE